MDATVFDIDVPLTRYDELFRGGGRPLPFLTRNDLDMLFDYLLAHSFDALRLKAEWDRASARGEHELFLASLARVVGRRGVPLYIVRTKKDGTKLVKDLTEGFVSVFLDCNFGI